MKALLVAVSLTMLTALCGCGVDVLVSTSISGELESESAQQSLKVLYSTKIQAALNQLRQAIGMFQAQNGRYPFNIDELRKTGYLPGKSELPEGVEIRYDPMSGDVWLEDVSTGELFGKSSSTGSNPSVPADVDYQNILGNMQNQAYYTQPRRPQQQPSRTPGRTRPLNVRPRAMPPRPQQQPTVQYRYQPGGSGHALDAIDRRNAAQMQTLKELGLDY